MINRLKLQNFKKHANLTVEFSQGLNAVVGDNSAGKTTLLRALNYAFFGGAAAGVAAHLKRWDADGPMVVTVDLTLPKYGRVTLTRGTSTASVKQGDKILASGQTPVTEFLESVLGESSKVLRLMVYSPQGETQGLVAMGATSLQRKVEEISHADVVDKVLALLRSDLATIDGKLWEITASLGEGDVDAELAQERAQLPALEKAHEEDAAMVETCRRLHDRAHGEMSGARGVAMLRSNNEGQLQMLASRLSALQDPIARAEQWLQGLPYDPDASLAAATSRLEAVRTAHEELKLHQQRRVDVHQQSEKLVAQLNALEAKRPAHNAAQDLVARLEPARQQAETDYVGILEAYGKAKAAYEQALTNLSSSICPTCKRPMEGVHIEHAKAERDRAAGELHLAQSKKEIHEQAMMGMRQRIIEAKRDLVPGLDDQISGIEAQLKALPNLPDRLVELGQAADLLKQVQHTVNAAQELAKQAAAARGDLQRLTTERKELTDKQQALIKEITALPVVDLPALEREERRLADKLEELREKSRVSLDTLQTCRWKISSLEERKQRIDSQLARRKELEQRRPRLAALLKYLTDNRAKLMSEVWDSLLSYASSRLDSMTSGLLTSLQRDDDVFTVVEEGRTVPVAELGGARKSMVGLCLRVSLAKVFYGNMLPLWLDEVSSDMKEHNAAAVAGMLQSLGQQVVMVTHREGDRVNADTVIAL